MSSRLRDCIRIFVDGSQFSWLWCLPISYIVYLYFQNFKFHLFVMVILVFSLKMMIMVLCFFLFKNGDYLQCSNSTCRVAYHPLCARAAGLCIEVGSFSLWCFFLKGIPVVYSMLLCSLSLLIVLSSLRMRTGSIWFLLRMMRMISAFVYFPSARSIDSQLMSVQFLMKGLGKLFVLVLTITHLLIHQAVLALVW